MRRFSLGKKTEVQVYFKYKYRDLIDKFLKVYYAGRLEMDRIHRFVDYSEGLFAAGDIHGAREVLEAALQACPHNAQCHNNLGVFHWITGDLEKAVEYFASARLLDPNHRDTVWNCGQVMADAREYVTAKYIYNQYMSRNGYDEEMAREIANM